MYVFCFGRDGDIVERLFNTYCGVKKPSVVCALIISDNAVLYLSCFSLGNLEIIRSEESSTPRNTMV